MTRPSPSTSAVALSAGSLLLVALLAAIPGSALHPLLPPGSVPDGPLLWLARALSLDQLQGEWQGVASVVATFFAAGSFLLLLRETWRGNVSMRVVLALVGLAHAVVLLLPLLYSRDVYSYAIYGRIASIYHANPYVQTPADFPHDLLAPFVGPKWFDTPAVYGPAFTMASAQLTRVVGSIEGLIVAFRVMAALASLATVGLVWSLARRLRPSRAVFAVAAFGLNPVVLFQGVASGHNDLLVGLAVAASLALVLARRDLLAVVVLTLGTLVKASAALPLLLLVAWIIWRRPSGGRLRAVLVHGGAAAGLGLAFAAPFFTLEDPTLGMVELAGHEGWLAPFRLIRRLFDALSGDTLGWLARVGFAAVLAWLAFILVRAIVRRAAAIEPSELAAAWGWGLLLLMFLGPVLLPWYVTWALPVLILLPRVPRASLLIASTALMVAQWATEANRFHDVYKASIIVGHYVAAPIMFAVGIWLVSDLRRRIRSGASLQDEPDDVPAPAG